MQTTGLFTTHVYDITFDKYGEPIYLIPFGDVHRSSPMCDVERWKATLDWAKTKKRCYFLGMGDYDDLGSTSERRLLGSPDLHESTHQTLERLYLKHTKRFAEEISMMKGRLIGLMEGNHYGQFPNGTTTTQKLCELMECRYLGVSSFIRLRFNSRNKHGARMATDIWCHHGRGAARLVGGSLNRVEQMAECAEADIYLMGHDHKKSIGTKTRFQLVPAPNAGVRLSHRKVLLARTGSFLKAYEEGQPSYIVDMAAGPSDLGVVKIEMTPKREQKDNKDREVIDLHGSI